MHKQTGMHTHKHTIITHQNINDCSRRSHLDFAEKELNYKSCSIVAYAPGTWQPCNGTDVNSGMSALMIILVMGCIIK